VLSTLIKLRGADTLAGETISSLMIGHRRVPTRLLGWGAAAFGMLAIIGSVLTQGGTGPVANAASGERGLALPAPPERRAPPAPEQPAIAPQPVEPATKAETPPAAGSSSAAFAKTSGTQRSRQRAVPVAAAPAPETAAKSRRPAHSAATRPATVAKPAAKKSIDQEFGF
jgi:hypothetical protein